MVLLHKCIVVIFETISPWQSASWSQAPGIRLCFQNHLWTRREFPTCAEIGVTILFQKPKFETYLVQVQWCSGCVRHLFPRWRQKWRRGQRRRSLQGRGSQRRTWGPCREQVPEKLGHCSPWRSERWWGHQHIQTDLLHIKPQNSTSGNERVWDGPGSNGVQGIWEEGGGTDVAAIWNAFRLFSWFCERIYVKDIAGKYAGGGRYLS